MRTQLIEEETEVIYEKYEDLSYKEILDINVELYVKGVHIGDIEVWKDSEMDGREYVCINYTIVYLDDITKIKMTEEEQHEVLINAVIHNIQKDIISGDVTAIAELLTFVPKENLEGFLPEKLD